MSTINEHSARSLRHPQPHREFTLAGRIARAVAAFTRYIAGES